MKTLLVCASALATTCLVSPVYGQIAARGGPLAPAQDSPAESGGPTTPSATAPATVPVRQGAALEEIVVTAQKRSENLQRVPISVTSVSGANLAASGIASTASLAVAIPTLVYTGTGAYAQPYLRGVGSEIAIPNADPSVTTYIDGVVVSANTAIIQNLLGVERVEVLEGPQGTLYGRNATAGAINIYTLTPTSNLDAMINGQIGNFNMRQLTGYVSGGLTDTLAVGVYGGYSIRDSYLTQLGNGPRPKHARGLAGRIKAVWEPTSAIKLTGSFEVSEEDNPETGAARNIQANNLSATLGAPSPAQKKYTINTGPDNRAGFVGTYNHTVAGTLREDIDLGFARFLGISGYRNFRSEQGVELDASPLPILSAYAFGRDKQFSQEAQLLSRDSSPIKWIVGGYYLHEVVKQDPQQILSQFILPAPVTGSTTFSTVTLNSFAAFAQATAPLDFVLPNASLTLGGRFTHDEKGWTSSGQLTTGPGGGTVIPGTFVHYPDAKEKWNNFSPKVTLEYRPVPDLMLYVTFARGYKAGAFNMTSPSDPQPPAISPEKLDDFEGGFKGEFFDRRVRFNMAIYHYKRSDIQTSVVGGGSNGVTRLENAGSATATGVEGNLTLAVFKDLTVQASGAWERSRYTDFTNATGFVLSPFGNANVIVDATGNTTPRAPRWVGSGSINYSHEFEDKSGISLNAAGLYNSGFFWDATNTLRQKAYAVLNLNAGYTLPGGRTTISAFAKNVTNQYYSTGTNYFPVAIGVYDAPPRMYGVSVQWGM